jgi:4-hydroxy-3-methylbut-2-en-1-yl diphosphate synthase IspG/GcpE
MGSPSYYDFLSQITIMGCMVNGPGEMADADFGYVGGAPGKIDLYVGKVMILCTRFPSFIARIFWFNTWLELLTG